MIIHAKSPVRVSLFGGGSDFPEYYNMRGGGVVSMAINMYQEFTLYTGNHTHNISGNKIPQDCSLDFVYAFQKAFDLQDSRFESDSDDILNSGLGSSAAAACAMVGAMSVAVGHPLTRPQTAERAWEVVNDQLKMFSGKQDEYASAMGGFNVFEFSIGQVNCHPLDRKYAEALMPSLVLMHTNTIRKSPTIQEGYKELTDAQIRTLDEIKELTLKAVPLIGEGDYQGLGKLLHKSWELKKQSNTVTTDRIDKIYLHALAQGAWGGKICGAGGGGCMIFIVDPKIRDKFIDSMVKFGLEWIDFMPDMNGLQVKILKR